MAKTAAVANGTSTPDGSATNAALPAVVAARTDTSAVAAAAANSFDTHDGVLGGGAALAVQLLGFAGTSVTFTVWDSADNVSFAAVSPALATGAMSAPAAASASISSGGLRRFVAVATTGTFTSAQFTAAIREDQLVVATSGHSAQAESRKG